MINLRSWLTLSSTVYRAIDSSCRKPLSKSFHILGRRQKPKVTCDTQVPDTPPAQIDDKQKITHGNFMLPNPQSIGTILRRHKVIPDVLYFPPKHEAEVSFKATKIKMGCEYNACKLKCMPRVVYPVCENSFYTVMLVDPDAPRRYEPSESLWLHWLVGNISGLNLFDGDFRVEYVPPAPPPDTGLHRYVFLVFRQENYNCYQEDVIYSHQIDGRSNFSLADYCYCYKLDELVAVNFCRCRFDCSVVDVYKKLGISLM